MARAGRLASRVDRWALALAAAAVAAAAVAAASSPSAAQMFIKRSSAVSTREPVDNVFPLPDREMLQNLAKAQELLKQEQYVDALRFLKKILEAPEDSFFQPEKNAPLHRSLKGEALRLIGQMSPAGLRYYESDVGPVAQEMLAKAKATGDMDLLGEVSRRFFHTQAGYEATFLLGVHHGDCSRPLAAALTLQRLRETAQGGERFEPTLSLFLAACWVQAGAPEKASQTLLELKDRYGGRPLEIGGRSVRWFAKPAGAVDWLVSLAAPRQAAAAVEGDRWAIFRGSPSRNATSAGSPPLLNLRWEVPIADDPNLANSVRQLRQVYTEQDVPLLPGLHPLAVDDVVFMRTVKNLLAVDFTTGKRLWEVPPEEGWEGLPARTTPETLLRQSPQGAVALGQRLWSDYTYGTLSSDGRYVFSIEELGFNFRAQPQRAVIIGANRVQSGSQGPYSVLAARCIRSGKLKWQIGGPAEQFALRHAETFFLGPPLPLMGQLYALAENRSQGAILLMALDPQTGDLVWSQPLAVVDRDLPEDPQRRIAGVSPSYADGILVCPTSCGAVVAVDLATRALLWGYRYGRTENPNRYQHVMIMRMGVMYPQGQPYTHHWADASATIANGRVLVTPVESDRLHCVNLADGKLLWTCPRKDDRHDDLYVACVYQDKVILAGRREVRAVSLSETVQEKELVDESEGVSGIIRRVQVDNGETKKKEVTVVRPKPAWGGRMVALPEGATPSGRGFLAANRYYLPLSNASVAAVDLDAGRIVRTSKSREGNVPGNLICYKGKILSQGFDRLEVFYQLDAAAAEADRKLAANAEDPEGLSLRGEILLDEGKHAEAVACFRRGCQAGEDLRTRMMLREALLEGLRVDFAAHRNRAEEIERLLDDATQRAAFVRLMAAGYQQSGQWRAALEQYAKLIDLDASPRQTESVSPTQSVRRDRWVQTQLALLRGSVKDPAALAEIDRAVAERLQAAVKSSDVAVLWRFLDYFGNQPVAGEARGELIRRLADAGRFLEAELLLWDDQRSADPAVAAPAVAALAELLRKAGREEDAAICFRRLAGPLANVVCLEGKTGKQLVEALPEGTLRQAIHAQTAWPAGLVESKIATTGVRQPNYGRMSLRFDGDPGPFFRNTMIQFDQSRHPRSLMAYDGCGQERWQLTINEPVQSGVYYNRGWAQSTVHGHLLLVSMGTKTLAIDTLGLPGQRAPRVLWDQDSVGVNLELAGLNNQVIFGPGIFMPFAFQPFAYGGRYNSQVNTAAASTSRYCCFQRFRNLVAVDPLNGEVLWAYQGVPPASELFGDEQYVFALPLDQREAMVLRALDGQLLGKRAVPRFAPSGNEPAVDNRGQPLKLLPLSFSCLATIGRNLLLWHRDPQGEQRVLELFDPWEQRQTWPPRKFAAGAVAATVGEEAVGVCEPDGHFVLLRLPDGGTIVDTKLKVNGSLASLGQLLLMRSGDQYLMLANNRYENPNPQRNVGQLPGMMSLPILRACVFAFDLEGKPAWPEPVMVEYQHFNPDQPRQLPVLVFACQEYIRQGNTGRSQLSILCLDKRSGRKVFSSAELPDQQKLPASTGMFEIAGDPNKHTVDLRLQQQTVTLTFTDKPLPPEAPPKPAEKSQGSKTPRALWEAIKKAAGVPSPRGVIPGIEIEQNDLEIPVPVPIER